MNLPSRREHRPPDRARAALLRGALRACAAARCGSPTCSATRPACRRSSPPAGWTASSPRSCRGTAQNRFPHSTFWWEGIDGTRVLTHFPPVDTYNAEITPAEIAYSVGRFAEHEWSGVVADAVRLRRRRRRADAGDARAAAPARPTSTACRDVEQGSPAEFFDARRAPRSPRGAPVPVWRGELYFETHRGTLTSQLRTKLGNRRCERLLREAELWTAHAGGGDPARARRAVAGGADAAVPRHHPRLVDRLGARRRRGGPRPHRRRARGAHRGAARRRWRPAGPVLANLGHRRPRRGRRRRRRRRPATGRCRRSPTGGSAFRARVPGLGLAPAVAAGDRRPGRRHRPLDGERPPRRGVGPRRQPALGHRRRPRPRAAARPAQLGAVLELAVDQPGALRRVGPRVVGARRPRAAHRGRRASTVVERGPLVGMVRVRRSFGPSIGDADVRAAGRVAAPRRRTSSSTGTTRSTCCRWRSRSTCAPTRRRAACSSAPCAARPTRRRRGTPPSSRCAPTATSTSPSRRSASPCSTTAATATHVFDGAVRVSLVRGARYPDPTPTRAATT